MKKKILLGGLALLLAVSLVATGCQAPPEAEVSEVAEEPTYHWIMACDYSPGQPAYVADMRFAKTVLDASDGRIVIDVHPGGVLGDWIIVFEEIMRGTVQFYNVCLPSVYDPRLGVSYIPYLVTSWDEVMVVYTPGGFIYETVDGILANLGVKLLSSWPTGFFGVGIKGDCPPSPKDPDVAKNLKIRIWADPAPEAIIEFFGYMPTVIPFADTYAALAMGVVDGVCTDLPDQLDYFGDQIDCFIYDTSLFECWFYLTNLEIYNALSPADQKIILDAALYEQDARIKEAEEWEEKDLQEFRDQGTEVILFTPEELAELRDRAVEELWPKLYGTIGKKIMMDAADAVAALK